MKNSSPAIVAAFLLLLFNPESFAATTIPITTQPSTAPATDPIHNRLQHAKEDYDNQVDAARKKLVAYFGTRADSAQRRGDLAELKNYQGIKSRFETDGQLSENSVDLPLRDNINAYLSATRLASKNLGNAYFAAVRDYTKAGLIDQADVLQAESDLFQKGVPAVMTPASPAAPGSSSPAPTASAAPSQPVGNGLWFIFSPTSGLPKFFEPNPEVTFSTDGLSFPATSFLRTAKTDFINSDFAFDVVILVKGPETMKVGIGQGSTGKPAFYGIEMNNGTALAYAVGTLGKVGAGTHLLHVEKKGSAFTSAIVLNYAGRYNPDYSRTSDIRHLKYLTADNTRLFIAANGPAVIIKQIRLTVP
jgi:hypothetical protein